MSIENGVRALEDGIKTDFSRSTDYAGYLDLDTLLSAQHPISDHHDEPLFIIQHQTSELWLKLVLHELAGVRENLDADDVSRARKGLSRVKHIFHTLTDQWSVLATLTPSEYAEFRGVLGSSSGFQSYQYRAVEFILGNKNAALLAVFESRPETKAMLAENLQAPTVYDAFLRFLARRGHPVPQQVLERDVSQAWVQTPELVGIYKTIYEDTDTYCRSTPPARTSLTWRTPSSSGGSGTCARCSAPSGSSPGPAAAPASRSCAARLTSRSSPRSTR